MLKVSKGQLVVPTQCWQRNIIAPAITSFPIENQLWTTDGYQLIQMLTITVWLYSTWLALFVTVNLNWAQ